MSERVVTLAVDTQEDYDRRQAFKKGLRQRVPDEKAAEEPVGYQCDGPTTHEERRQIRARARAAAQERWLKEKEAAARRAEIETQQPRQRRKAA